MTDNIAINKEKHLILYVLQNDQEPIYVPEFPAESESEISYFWIIEKFLENSDWYSTN